MTRRPRNMNRTCLNASIMSRKCSSIPNVKNKSLSLRMKRQHEDSHEDTSSKKLRTEPELAEVLKDLESQGYSFGRPVLTKEEITLLQECFKTWKTGIKEDSKQIISGILSFFLSFFFSSFFLSHFLQFSTFHFAIFFLFVLVPSFS